MLNSIEFFVSEAWTGFKRSGIMSFVAIGTVIVSLTIFGVFLMGVVNLGSIIGTISSNVQVSAYVDRSLERSEADSITNRISMIRGVSDVRYVPRAEAWEKFKKEYSGNLKLEDVVSDNPLPDTFIVQVQVPELVPSVAKQISGMASISEVRYSGKLIEQVESLASAVRVGGLILVCMLSVATLLIVMNTIRLTVIAREKDISIMKLVGATDTFIKWPFIIEGLIIGLVGAIFGELRRGALDRAAVADQVAVGVFVRVKVEVGVYEGVEVNQGVQVGVALGVYVSVQLSVQVAEKEAVVLCVGVGVGV